MGDVQKNVGFMIWELLLRTFFLCEERRTLTF